LRAYYHPHHERLPRAVRASLEATGQALILDCHSFPSHPLPCDLDQALRRPEFCLGTDPFHTPAWIPSVIGKALSEAGWGHRIDQPYAGTIVPLERLYVDARVLSVMIEVRRDLYMDEATGAAHGGMKVLIDAIGRVVGKLREAAKVAKVRPLGIDAGKGLRLEQEELESNK
ncbi:MAG: N-formylglutamate amidohydrolase, partial [Spirochaetota bacterium]